LMSIWISPSTPKGVRLHKLLVQGVD